MSDNNSDQAKPSTPEAGSEEAPKSLAQLKELMLRGKTYREEKVYEVFGGHVTLVWKPIPDKHYIPLMTMMEEKIGMDEDEVRDDLKERLDEADELDEVSLAGIDEEFMHFMEAIVELGIDGEAMDGELSDLTDALDDAVGGYLLAWAFDVMELTGDMMDAKRFRGGRNRA
jgi:hypothetical protein